MSEAIGQSSTWLWLVPHCHPSQPLNACGCVEESTEGTSKQVAALNTMTAIAPAIPHLPATSLRMARCAILRLDPELMSVPRSHRLFDHADGLVDRYYTSRRSTLFHRRAYSHTCRKTVATRLDEAGLSAREVADHLGHAEPSMTQDVYRGRAVASAAAEALGTGYERHRYEREEHECRRPPRSPAA
jgi:hypothetical protein